MHLFSKAAKAKHEAAKRQKEQQKQLRASTFLQTPTAPVSRSLSNGNGYGLSNTNTTASNRRRSSASSRSSIRKVPYTNNSGPGYGNINNLPPPAYTAAVTPNLQNAIQANLYAGPSPPSSRRNSVEKPGLFERTFTTKQSHQTLRQMRSGDGDLTAYKILQQLRKNVKDKHLQRFYDDKALARHAKDLYGKRSCQTLKKSWRLTDDEACESSILCLWDVCLLIDDSGSMEYYHERKEHLKDYISRITPALTYFDRNGIDLYFMNNTDKNCENQTDKEVVKKLIEDTECTGATPLGNTLEVIVEGIKTQILSRGGLKKPVQILILTDGEPQGDGPRQDLRGKDAEKRIETYIENTMAWLRLYGCSEYTITYQFAQVGNDEDVEKWFTRIDNHPIIGKVIDCTSRFEAESLQAGPKGLKLYHYLLKLLLGAIGDRDKVDER